MLHTDIPSSESGIIDETRPMVQFSDVLFIGKQQCNSFEPWGHVTPVQVLTHGPESYRLPSTMQSGGPDSPPPLSWNVSLSAGDHTYMFGRTPRGTPSGTAQHRHNHPYVNVPTILRIFFKLATDTTKSTTGIFIPMKQHLFVSPPQTPQSPLVENRSRIY